MTATAWEALALARAGIPDLLVGNVVRGAARCAAVAEVAGRTSVLTVVDDLGNADELAAAARTAGVEIGVLVDVDVGLGRTGARTPDEALGIGRYVTEKAGLRLRGILGYEGQVALDQDDDRRRAGAAAACDRLGTFVDVFRADGLALEIVSAGGTGMWDSTGRDPRVTELQAGSYIFMDTTHMCQIPDPEVSLHVLGTVMTQKDATVVLDTGRKALGTVDPVRPDVQGVPGTVRIFSEEHLVIDTDATPPRPGQVVQIIPSYAPAAVTLHEVYHLVEDGRVVGLWPVLTRAAGREGAR